MRNPVRTTHRLDVFRQIRGNSHGQQHPRPTGQMKRSYVLTSGEALLSNGRLWPRFDGSACRWLCRNPARTASSKIIAIFQRGDARHEEDAFGIGGAAQLLQCSDQNPAASPTPDPIGAVRILHVDGNDKEDTTDAVVPNTTLLLVLQLYE